MGLDRVHSKLDIGIFIVDEGAKDAERKVARLVAELLAGLVELFGDFAGWRLILQIEHHLHDARSCKSLDAIVPMQFLQPLLQRIRDQILHFLCRGARPYGGDGESLDREGRILGAAQIHEGIDSG